MLVYRICKLVHAPLDGEGARLFGGRWNSAGRPAIYSATHLSLAALEYLVHLDFDNLPSDLVWLKIEIPDGASIETYPQSVAPNETIASTFGDAWLETGNSLCLDVPSAVLSVERNIILNPRHPEMGRVKTIETNDFEFDDRLFNR
jgi:RES domain-containing protein